MDDVLKYVDTLAKIAVPIAIYLATRKIARAQFTNTAQNGWNEFNKLVIANKENSDAVVKYMHPPAFVGNNPDLLRKAYLGFIYLNAANTYFVGLQNGLIDADEKEAQFSHLLGPLLLDDDFFQMSQGRGYHPKFSQACQEARNRATAEAKTSVPKGTVAG
jgi:hypothetical protein